jgi:hypothetical protein
MTTLHKRYDVTIYTNNTQAYIRRVKNTTYAKGTQTQGKKILYIVSSIFSHSYFTRDLTPALHVCLLRGTNWVFKRLRFVFKGLKPTGYVMHHQFNIQHLYALPTLYLCVLYLFENKQRLVPLTA